MLRSMISDFLASKLVITGESNVIKKFGCNNKIDISKVATLFIFLLKTIMSDFLISKLVSYLSK